MPYQNPRIGTLKEMMRLEEKRAGLQSEIDSLVQRLSDLREQLFEPGVQGSASSGPPKTSGRGKAARRGSAAPRRERGALKEQIIAALEAAGSNGVRVKDLAAAIGIKPVNVHAWFHAALKRFPQIQKVEGGHYRAEGKIELPPRAHGSGGRPRGSVSRGARKSTSPGSRPGELSSRILAELQSAGEGGMSISNLSEKLGVNYRNISVWFSTTGKKNPQVKKISPAVYRLEATNAGGE